MRARFAISSYNSIINIARPINPRAIKERRSLSEAWLVHGFRSVTPLATVEAGTAHERRFVSLEANTSSVEGDADN
jgi:hypothetical protein